MRAENLRRGIVQEYKLSKPVRSSTSGRFHAASVRAVYCNRFIDCYWRLAREPFDDDRPVSRPEQVLCVFTHPLYGGTLERMNDEDKTIVASASQLLVEVFEREGALYLEQRAREKLKKTSPVKDAEE